MFSHIYESIFISVVKAKCWLTRRVPEYCLPSASLSASRCHDINSGGSEVGSCAMRQVLAIEE